LQKISYAEVLIRQSNKIDGIEDKYMCNFKAAFSESAAASVSEAKNFIHMRLSLAISEMQNILKLYQEVQIAIGLDFVSLVTLGEDTNKL